MSGENSAWIRFKKLFMIRPPVDVDPRTLSSKTKAIILFGLVFSGSSAGFSSTVYFPGIPAITEDLNAPSIATTLAAALFILFMGIAPIFWASASDYFQIRRFILFLSMLIFAAASLGCAFVQNIWALVALRCVQAIGSSSGQSVGAGVVADCYPVEKRGAAFGKFFFGVFFGPLLGPIIGGLLIISPIGWRATFWFCFAFAGFIIIYLILVFPETYRRSDVFDVELPVTAQNSDATSATPTIETDVQEKQHRLNNEEDIPIEDETKYIPKQSPPQTTPAVKVDPLSAFLLLRHPFILISSVVSGIAFGCMFAVETIIPDLYFSLYGFNSWQIGLSYLGAGVGNLCGSILSGILSDRLLLRSRAKRGGKAVVEDRLTLNLWPASLMTLFGVLLFGWSTERRLTVWAAIVAFGIQNFGMNQLTTSSSAYLVDAMPGGAASSASAAANLVRMVLACALTLAANPMVSSIGPGWTCVFLGGLTVISIILLIFLKIYGARLRKWSGYGDKEH